MAYLALLTVIIFPHQQKYALIYAIPAEAYMLTFSFLVIQRKWDTISRYKVIAVFSLLMLFASAIMGRDIVGDFIVDVIDFYHVFGLINLALVFLLLYIKPNHLLELTEESHEHRAN